MDIVNGVVPPYVAQIEVAWESDSREVITVSVKDVIVLTTEEGFVPLVPHMEADANPVSVQDPGVQVIEYVDPLATVKAIPSRV